MITAITILMVITLCGMTFTLGFFIGKGKIEVKRKLTAEEKQKIDEMEQKQKEALEKYNRSIDSIMGYTDLGGDD